MLACFLLHKKARVNDHRQRWRFLDESCATHFAGVKAHLDTFGIPWRVSHRLVRGLDYYTRTTFEILGAVASGESEDAESLGAQNALLGGGRYDGLVKDLGGPDRPGIGFAAGMERLVLALPHDLKIDPPAVACVVAIGDDGRNEALKLLRELRRAGVAAVMEFEARSLRAQMKRADRVDARVTVIVGGDELARGEVTLRNMSTGDQQAVPRASAVDAIRKAVA